MVKRGTYSLSDLFGVSPLIATSSIYPATQAPSPVLPSPASHDEADALLPWGCEQTDLAPQDHG
jgi:hypothetical protein